jgi:ribonucleoside-diphosphate reductase alpha chain
LASTSPLLVGADGVHRFKYKGSIAVREKVMTELLDSVPAHALSLIRRERLSETRRSITHKFEVNQLEGYITVGFYDDGRPGEVFVKIAKHGSTISGLLDTIAVLTSMALQYGVPVETLARKFEYTRFEPSGWTKNPELHRVNSIVDYLFRWLGTHCSDEYRAERTRKSVEEVDLSESV